METTNETWLWKDAHTTTHQYSIHLYNYSSLRWVLQVKGQGGRRSLRRLPKESCITINYYNKVGLGGVKIASLHPSFILVSTGKAWSKLLACENGEVVSSVYVCVCVCVCVFSLCLVVEQLLKLDSGAADTGHPVSGVLLKDLDCLCYPIEHTPTLQHLHKTTKPTTTITATTTTTTTQCSDH